MGKLVEVEVRGSTKSFPLLLLDNTASNNSYRVGCEKTVLSSKNKNSTVQAVKVAGGTAETCAAQT